MKQKGWSRLDLARVAHISASHITRIMNAEVSPSADYIASIANALSVPSEDAFRAVDLLPQRPEMPPGAFEWQDLYLSASEDQREELLACARFQAACRKQSTQIG